MDDSVLNTLVAAVNTQHNPTTAQDQRASALNYCEDFKANHANPIPYAMHLLAPGQDDRLRHFGLHVLEYTIKYRWTGLNPAEQGYLRSTVITLLAQGTQPIEVEKGFVKEKTAVLVVEVAKREWPQRWPDMVDQLMAVSQSGQTQTELVCLVLRSLAEDVLIFNSDMDDSRRSDLSKGMNATLSQMLPFLHGVISTSGQGIEAQRESPRKADVLCMRAATLALQNLIESVPVNAIFEHNFLPLLFTLLSHKQFRMTAVESITALAHKRIRPAYAASVASMFEGITAVAESVPADDADEEDYLFQRKLAEAASVLGQELIGYALSEGLRPVLFRYLQIMLRFSAHPSLVLSGHTAPFWQTLMRNSEVNQQEWFKPVYPSLWDVFWAKVMRLGDPDNTFGSATSKYVEYDFDEKDEYTLYFGNYRGYVMLILKAIAGQQPVLCVDRMCELVESSVKSLPPNAVAVTTHSPEYVKLDGAGIVLECVLIAVPECTVTANAAGLSPAEAAANSHVRAKLEGLLQVLLNVQTTDGLILHVITNMLRYFIRFASHNRSLAPFILEKLFSTMLFLAPGETAGGQLSMATESARKKACSVLIVMGSSYPEVLFPFFNDLISKVKGLLDARALKDSQFVLLFEALVTLSNSLKNYDQQQDFIRGMLAVPMAGLFEESVARYVADETGVLTLVGMTSASAAAGGANSNVMRTIYHGISSFLAVSRRVSVPRDTTEQIQGGFRASADEDSPMRWPCQEMLRSVMPAVIHKLVRSIHRLSKPEARSLVLPQFSALYDIPDVERAQFVGTDDHAHGEAMSKGVAPEVKAARNWISTVREASFGIYGVAMANDPGFFQDASLPQVMWECIFSHMESIDLWQTRAIMKLVVTPLTRCCKPHAFEGFLGRLLPPFFSALLQKLNAEWQRVEAADLGGDDGEDTEILRDTVLRTVTRQLSDLFFEVALTHVVTKEKARMDDSNAPDKPEKETRFVHEELVSYLFGSHNTALPMFYTLIGMLSWPDSQACRKAVMVCQKIVPRYINDANYHHVLGSHMMQTTLSAIPRHNKPSSGDLQSELTTLIRIIYVPLMGRSDAAKTAILQLPKVTAPMLAAFEANISKIVQEKSQDKGEKKMRQSFSKFLTESLDAKITWKKETNIHALAERLVLQSTKMNELMNDHNREQAEGDLGNFFASITDGL